MTAEKAKWFDEKHVSRFYPNNGTTEVSVYEREGSAGWRYRCEVINVRSSGTFDTREDAKVAATKEVAERLRVIALELEAASFA